MAIGGLRNASAASPPLSSRLLWPSRHPVLTPAARTTSDLREARAAALTTNPKAQKCQLKCFRRKIPFDQPTKSRTDRLALACPNS